MALDCAYCFFILLTMEDRERDGGLIPAQIWIKNPIYLWIADHLFDLQHYQIWKPQGPQRLMHIARLHHMT